MTELEQGVLLRIYIGEGDRSHGRPRYRMIIDKAREMGLSGATVLQGVVGYGALGKVRTAKILRLSEDLPLVIEIVDDEEQIEQFLPELEEIMGEGVITLEKVRMKFYRFDGVESRA